MKKRLLAFFVVMSIMAILAPVVVLADPLTWHSAQLIENNAGKGGYNSQVALSGASAVAVWQQSDGTTYRIYSNYSTDGGATWHSAQLIENNAGKDGYSPQVALSGLNAVVVWQQWYGSNWRIYSNYSTDGGATWHNAQLIENNAGKSGAYPQVALSGNNAIAVWYQSDGSNNRIYSNYSTDGGATWHNAQLLESNAGKSGYGSQVALSGANAVAVWNQSDGLNRRIYSNYSTDGGATWHSAQLIENNAGKDGWNPQVALYGLNAVAVWQQWDGSNWRIYSNYSTDGGATWQSSAQLIENNAGQNGIYPQVALSGLNAVAVWQQLDGSNIRIYSNYSADGGATWHSAQLIENNTGKDGDEPQVALSGNNAVAVWQQLDGFNWRIYSNYSTDGGATWHGAQLINNVGKDGYHPQVALSGSSAVAVWDQWEGSFYRIYSNYGTVPGPQVPGISLFGLVPLILLFGFIMFWLLHQRPAKKDLR